MPPMTPHGGGDPSSSKPLVGVGSGGMGEEEYHLDAQISTYN